MLASVIFFVAVTLPVLGERQYTYYPSVVTRDDARTLCQDSGLELAVMTSSEDKQKVLDLISGLNPTSDVWLDLTYDGAQYVWPGGHVLSWTDWKGTIDYNTPADKNAEACVLALKPDAEWSGRDCTDDQYDTLCYDPVADDYEVISSPVEYVDAFAECNGVSKLMPKMTSDDDVKILTELWISFPSATHFWIGLRYNGSHYVWFDGTLPTWVNWDVISGPEPATPATKSCVVIDRVTRSWVTRDCTMTASVLCYSDNPERFQLTAADADIASEVPDTTITGCNLIVCAGVCKTEPGCTHFVIDGNVCKTYSVSTSSLNTVPKTGARTWEVMLST